MSSNYTPAPASALRDAFPIQQYSDPRNYTSNPSSLLTAKHFAAIVSEILGLITGSVAGPNWRHPFSAATGDIAPNDPVYIQTSGGGAGLLAKAKATTFAEAQVIGYARTIITGSPNDTVYLDSFCRVACTGSPGQLVYLDDTGTPSVIHGTLYVPIGVCTGDGYALLWSSPLPQRIETTPACVLSNSGAQSIADSSYEVLTFDTVVEDNNSMAGTNKIVIKTPGHYILVAGGAWAANAAGARQLRLQRNGTDLQGAHINLPACDATQDTDMQLSAVANLGENDEITLRGQQFSTGALNITGARLSAVRLGA